MKLAHVLKLLVVATSTAALATSAKADITYNYTGNAFNVGTGSITATVTFDPTVTPTFSGNVTLGNIVSWSIVSGALSFSSLIPVEEPDTTGFIPLQFTFQSGSIVRWDFAHNPPGPAGYDVYTLGMSFVVGGGVTEDGGPTGSITGNAGIWAPVPEPAPLALLLLGLAFTGLVRKSRAK